MRVREGSAGFGLKLQVGPAALRRHPPLIAVCGKTQVQPAGKERVFLGPQPAIGAQLEPLFDLGVHVPLVEPPREAFARSGHPHQH